MVSLAINQTRKEEGGAPFRIIIRPEFAVEADAEGAAPTLRRFCAAALLRGAINGCANEAIEIEWLERLCPGVLLKSIGFLSRESRVEETEARPEFIRLSLVVEATERRPEVTFVSLADATEARPDLFSFPVEIACEVVFVACTVFPFVPLPLSDEDDASFAFPPTRAKEARLPLSTIEGA